MLVLLNRRIKSGRGKSKACVIGAICTFQSACVPFVCCRESWVRLKKRVIVELEAVAESVPRANTNNNEKQSNFPPYLPHCFRIDRDERLGRDDDVRVRRSSTTEAEEEGWTEHVFYEPQVSGTAKIFPFFAIIGERFYYLMEGFSILPAALTPSLIRGCVR